MASTGNKFSITLNQHFNFSPPLQLINLNYYMCYKEKKYKVLQNSVTKRFKQVLLGSLKMIFKIVMKLLSYFSYRKVNDTVWKGKIQKSGANIKIWYSWISISYTSKIHTKLLLSLKPKSSYTVGALLHYIDFLFIFVSTNMWDSQYQELDYFLIHLQLLELYIRCIIHIRFSINIYLIWHWISLSYF